MYVMIPSGVTSPRNYHPGTAGKIETVGVPIGNTYVPLTQFDASGTARDFSDSGYDPIFWMRRLTDYLFITPDGELILRASGSVEYRSDNKVAKVGGIAFEYDARGNITKIGSVSFVPTAKHPREIVVSASPRPYSVAVEYNGATGEIVKLGIDEVGRTTFGAIKWVGGIKYTYVHGINDGYAEGRIASIGDIGVKYNFYRFTGVYAGYGKPEKIGGLDLTYLPTSYGEQAGHLIKIGNFTIQYDGNERVVKVGDTAIGYDAKGRICKI